jgi:hypothetical protein
MSIVMKLSALVLVLTLAGCAVPKHGTGTYSGDAKAALLETGNSIGAFVRKSLTKPMPAWEQTTSGSTAVVEMSATPQPATPSPTLSETGAIVETVVPASSGVEVYAVSPTDTAPRGISLTQDELRLKNPNKSGNN